MNNTRSIAVVYCKKDDRTQPSAFTDLARQERERRKISSNGATEADAVLGCHQSICVYGVLDNEGKTM